MIIALLFLYLFLTDVLRTWCSPEMIRKHDLTLPLPQVLHPHVFGLLLDPPLQGLCAQSFIFFFIWSSSLINYLCHAERKHRKSDLTPHSWWTPLAAQMVKNLPAMQETQVWYLGREDPLEKEMLTHSSLLAWRSPMDRGAWRATLHGVAKRRTQLSDQYYLPLHLPSQERHHICSQLLMDPFHHAHAQGPGLFFSSGRKDPHGQDLL